MSQKIVHSPRLATIKMVEEALIKMPNSVMKIAELKRALPKQVNHNTLKEILEYLLESRKIVMGTKGITWIENDSPEFKRFIGKTTPLSQIISEKELEEHIKK
jgi:hypothetical protein